MRASFSFTHAEKERFFRLKSIFRDHQCFVLSDYLDRESLEYADFYAGQGSIDGLKWCVEIEEYVFFSNTLVFAVSRNHRQVIKWLREHGCPWGERAMSLARYYNYDNLVKWLKEEGCPSPRIKIEEVKPINH